MTSEDPANESRKFRILRESSIFAAALSRTDIQHVTDVLESFFVIQDRHAQDYSTIGPNSSFIASANPSSLATNLEDRRRIIGYAHKLAPLVRDVAEWYEAHMRTIYVVAYRIEEAQDQFGLAAKINSYGCVLGLFRDMWTGRLSQLQPETCTEERDITTFIGFVTNAYNGLNAFVWLIVETVREAIFMREFGEQHLERILQSRSAREHINRDRALQLLRSIRDEASPGASSTAPSTSSSAAPAGTPPAAATHELVSALEQILQQMLRQNAGDGSESD